MMQLKKILHLKNQFKEIITIKNNLDKLRKEVEEELVLLKTERNFLSTINKRIADVENTCNNTSSDISILAKAIGELYVVVQEIILSDIDEDIINNKKKITYH